MGNISPNKTKYYKRYRNEDGAFMDYIEVKGQIRELKNPYYRYELVTDEKILNRIHDYKKEINKIRSQNNQRLRLRYDKYLNY